MTVTYEVHDRIASIAFTRPEKHNAVRLEEIVGLADRFAQFDDDPDADVAILHGPGPSFSSGGDLVTTQSELDAGGVDAQSAAERRVRAAIFEATHFKPAIATIHGNCLGNTIGWAFMCDLVVAARGTRLQVTETRFGLAATNFWLAMGAGAFALDVTLTARAYTAQEAFHAGAIARISEEGEHLAEARRLARQILENPRTRSVRSCGCAARWWRSGCSTSASSPAAPRPDSGAPGRGHLDAAVRQIGELERGESAAPRSDPVEDLEGVVAEDLPGVLGVELLEVLRVVGRLLACLRRGASRIRRARGRRRSGR